MKYIDAEKLKAEIKRYKNKADERLKIKGRTFSEEQKDLALQNLCGNLLHFIDSLQQEKQTDRQVIVITESHGYANIEWDCRSIDDVKGLLAAGAHYVSKHQEQPEVDLEKFTEKMDDWKARYKYPDNTPIKATMAFTARMFYMYPDVAREWYDNLPKATMD